MAEIVTSAGIGGSTNTLTTGVPSPEPSGANLFVLGIAIGEAVSDVAFTSFEDDGDPLVQAGSDVPIAFGTFTLNAWRKAPANDGAVTYHAESDGNPTGVAAISAVVLSGVDQSVPLGSLVGGVAGPDSFSTATKAIPIVMTGLIPGQRAIAVVGVGDIGGGGFLPGTAGISAGADTTIVRDSRSPSTGYQVAAVVCTGVADGFGDLTMTLNVEVADGSSNIISDGFFAYPVNDAAGGGEVAAGPRVGTVPLRSKLQGLVQ
jgi:hypothetical protein